jgi:hypothetical protein
MTRGGEKTNSKFRVTLLVQLVFVREVAGVALFMEFQLHPQTDRDSLYREIEGGEGRSDCIN